ncbi:MAG TPA: terminase family protein [Trichocoleus sp.]|jgi:hypothetical protein
MSKLALNLHRSQAQVFQDAAQFKLLVASRRWGKSRLLLTSIIHAALSFNQAIDPASPPVILLAAPTLKQVKAVHWKPLLNLLEGKPFIKSINKSDYRIDFKGNKPSILLRGTNDGDGDGLRGLKLYFAGLDEIQDIKEIAWEEAIFPALADTPGSRALLIGTPKGLNHWLYSNLYQKAIATAGWGYHHYTALDNPFLPRSFINRARRDLPERVFKQEFLAEFTTFEGQLLDCLEDHHLLDILPAEFDSVLIGVDHGDQNPCLTVIGLKQGVYYILDCWTNPHPGQPVTPDQVVEQAAQLCQKYNVHRCYLPDDRPAAALTFRRHGDRHNIGGLKRSVTVTRNKPGVMEGVGILNSLFHQDRLYINKRLQPLINDFKSYHRATDSEGNFLDKPAEGQADHTVDATRYALSTLEFRHNILAAA